MLTRSATGAVEGNLSQEAYGIRYGSALNFNSSVQRALAAYSLALVSRIVHEKNGSAEFASDMTHHGTQI